MTASGCLNGLSNYSIPIHIIVVIPQQRKNYREMVTHLQYFGVDEIIGYSFKEIELEIHIVC